MTKIDHLRQLAILCRDFGGKLAIVSQREYDRLFEKGDSAATPWNKEDLSASPFTSAHGIWWRRKIVYTVRDREEIGSIIHEMGHVFAACHHPHHDCSQCAEWNWLGWEVALARKIGAGRIWSKQNANYQVGEKGETTWKHLTVEARRAVVVDRLAIAKKIGVVDADGSPRSIR